ncbi:S-methyl-5-thioribose-1-phosphate isomerase [Syntrophotalea acetylenica]|jgi:methylthioribose-1-phosphate isomerase|uniref:Methylthioribose-1-phosphate isomerase n=1 Tax=Syntrophotalea acetylenica TaxID=29542 RepID=A0A1L3GHF6_SYNAC|nr:S-methyl-5-thioribose-1-phosphate isomerase [Syntrophotalea acetylenica]APG25372.1 S-methyl-5-thioribose-1-phosphate isomerase [Syntrophotalea acetylenica]APG43439.1 S-methyl-5-thioribose-1-phosphate isomerase [Syntrophotalea acetylenica]MDY0262610.1 S-methyl-5-thioribose-1-phosphate isomerase [Syntrophotalea acetylenica]
MSIRPIEYRDGAIRMIDQRLLPTQEVWIRYRDYQSVAEAIRSMVVRGAPAIGVAAAFGVAFGARDIAAAGFGEFYAELEKVCATLAATRPTAVNLFWALDRMRTRARQLAGSPLDDIRTELLNEALAVAAEDEAINRAMGRHGAVLIPDGARILTHCNAGALATGGYGTALGVIRAAVESGKSVSVLADETRPFLQGARLTAWELHKDGIPVTLICDNMAGALMRQGEIDGVIVGADRIAANGDVANKIGTYSVAVLAREHGLPFYVAAPLSTIDRNIADGDQIPIEERDAIEVTHCGATRLAPEGIRVRNPAFDVTPARLVTAIITERGVVRGDYVAGLAQLFREHR